MAKLAPARILSAEKTEIGFAEPFRISGYVFDAMRSIVVRIGSGGHVGRGEAAGIYYLGEGQQQMLETIASLANADTGSLNRLDLQQMLPPSGARNALDCALWDAESLQTRIPVWALAGVPQPRPLVTTLTLPAADPGELAMKIDGLGPAKAIKLKLSGDIVADAERIAVVRAARPENLAGRRCQPGLRRQGSR